MGDTKIQWTEKSWNPVAGCTPVSTGCRNCYAARMAWRLKHMGHGPYQEVVNCFEGDARFNGTVRCLPERLEEPLHWKKPRMVFVCSMGDLFHEEVPNNYIYRVFETIIACPQHTFQLLTKRPYRMRNVVNGVGWCSANAWMGVSVEDKRVLKRVRHVRETRAAVRFLSCEPLLGPLNHLPLDGIDWVIVGGETGPGARLCKVEWIRSIVEQCRAAGVAVYVKQLGAFGDSRYAIVERKNDDPGRWPEDVCVREYPTVVRAGDE